MELCRTQSLSHQRGLSVPLIHADLMMRVHSPNSLHGLDLASAGHWNMYKA